MELQKNILLFFTSIHNPVLNALAQFFTMFGEETLLIAVGVLVFWCIDKKKGFTVFFTMLTANTVMNILKIIVRFPRPWLWQWDGRQIEPVRQSTATGYSFPSGHTTSASSFYGSLAIAVKKRWFSICCALLIVFVGLSRMYLCVHWPLDVAGGLILGSSCALLLSPRLGSLFDEREKQKKLFPVLGAVCLAAGLVFMVIAQANPEKDILFGDLYKGFAIFGALFIFYPIEESLFGFSVEGTFVQKLIRYIAGMAGAFFFLRVVKSLLPVLPVVSYLRYFATGVWCIMWPVLGKKLKLFV